MHSKLKGVFSLYRSDGLEIHRRVNNVHHLHGSVCDDMLKFFFQEESLEESLQRALCSRLWVYYGSDSLTISLVVLNTEHSFLKKELSWQTTKDQLTKEIVKMGGNALFGEPLITTDIALLEKAGNKPFLPAYMKGSLVVRVSLYSRDHDRKGIVCEHVRSFPRKRRLELDLGAVLRARRSVLREVHRLVVDSKYRNVEAMRRALYCSINIKPPKKKGSCKMRMAVFIHPSKLSLLRPNMIWRPLSSKGLVRLMGYTAASVIGLGIGSFFLFKNKLDPDLKNKLDPDLKKAKVDVIRYRGLKNIGNTCYMNSALQVLLNTRLSEYIDKDIQKPVKEKEMEEYKKKYAHQMALRKVKQEYKNSNSNMRQALTSLHKVFTDKETQLVSINPGFNQEDAAEFLFSMLLSIGYCVNLQTKKMTINSDIKYESKKVSCEPSIHLPLQKPRTLNTLPNLIKSFTIEHKDDPKNSWKPTNDKDELIGEFQRYDITIKISNEIPDIIVILIKRWNEYRKKNDDPIIGMREEVDMRSLIEDSLLSDDACAKYQIVGVICHLGVTKDGGHYVADVRIDGKWKYFDDDRDVKDLNESDIEKHRAAGYVYVFERSTSHACA